MANDGAATRSCVVLAISPADCGAEPAAVLDTVRPAASAALPALDVRVHSAKAR